MECYFCCLITQSSLTLCNPMDGGPPDFPVLHSLPKFTHNSCLLSQWCHPTISSSAVPFISCPQSFPASGSFPIGRLFVSGLVNKYINMNLAISYYLNPTVFVFFGFLQFDRVLPRCAAFCAFVFVVFFCLVFFLLLFSLMLSELPRSMVDCLSIFFN